jgi:alkylation response protein AidB-like acyl-CoA dehydrogenase
VLRGADASAALLRIRAHFDLALACDALGGAEAVFDETLAYLHQRHQFNRPIASFQAIKHRCAEHKVSIEASRALVDVACRGAADQCAAWRTKAACARLYAGTVYRNLTEDCVQLHGGIGFTWEYPCHLFLKRARLGEILGGTPEQRKDQAAPALFGMLRRESRAAL